MKSYLEISIMLGISIMLTSFQIMRSLTHKRISLKRCTICALLLGGLSVLFCQDSFMSFVLLSSIVLNLIGFYPVYWIGSLCLYFVLINSFNYLDSVYSCGWILYADASSFEWIWIMLMMFFLCVTIKHLEVFFERSELYVPVQLNYEKYSVSCIGFLDTGNQCTFEGLPVVFVNQLEHYDSTVEVCGINGLTRLNSIQGSVSLYDQTFDAVIACVSDLQVECLLHSSMRC